MAAAEGERGLDFDADAIDGNAPAIMRAMHDKAADGDRRKSGEALPHPVRGGHGLERQRVRRIGTGGVCDQRAHRVFAERSRTINCHLPAAVAGVGEAHGGVVHRHNLGDGIGDPPRGFFIGREPRRHSRGGFGVADIRHDSQCVFATIPTIVHGAGRYGAVS